MKCKHSSWMPPEASSSVRCEAESGYSSAFRYTFLNWSRLGGLFQRP
jgi:hypothetical protein